MGDRMNEASRTVTAPRRGLGVCDPKSGTLVNVDPAFAQIHGYAVEELVGKPVEVIIAPEHRWEHPARARSADDAGHLTFESVNVRKDGSQFPVRVDVVVAKDGSGEPLCRAAIVEDLSEVAPDVTAVRESQARYPPAAQRVYRLTARETEVLHLVASGRTDKEIAQLLGRSTYTVHNHVRHILLKMGARSRTDATARALREDLV